MKDKREKIFELEKLLVFLIEKIWRFRFAERTRILTNSDFMVAKEANVLTQDLF